MVAHTFTAWCKKHRVRYRSHEPEGHRAHAGTEHRPYIKMKAVVAAPPPRARYSISVSSLNIGRYMAITIVPTMIPTPIIRIGSMIEVSA